MAIVKFGVVSGIGWLIDFGIFCTLVYGLEVRPMYANLVGASTAVTFVFFTSVYKVFVARHRFLLAKFLVYCLYQVFAVAGASWLVGFLSTRLAAEPAVTRVIASPGALAMIAKVLVTPATFYANFLFMAWLVTGRVRFR